MYAMCGVPVEGAYLIYLKHVRNLLGYMYMYIGTCRWLSVLSQLV